jgi:hypothetical protein
MALTFAETVKGMAALTTTRGPQHPWWSLAVGVKALMESKSPADVAAVAVIQAEFERVSSGV